MGRAVATQDEEPGAVSGRPERTRDEAPLAGQELDDQRPIPGSRIGILAETGVDPDVAGIIDREREALGEAQLAQPGRRALHAGAMAAERGRHADEDDRCGHAGSMPRPGGASRIMRRMRIADFALERYFARWEFRVRHLLCASDVEGYPMADLLELADEEAAGLWRDLRLGYTESTGHPLLRTEIAELYEHVGPDEVLVFAGAEEAIFCLVNVLVGPGDHVVVTWPGYQSLYEVARAAGAEVTLHELHESDRWEMDVERLIRELRPATKLVVVNAPHNPTGMLPTHAEWARLGDALADRGVTLLSDEVYRYLEFDERDRLLPGADVYPKGVSLGVVSKSFAMAGLRIGWLASRDGDLLERCARFKDYTTICSAAPSEILALIGLRARERVLGRSLRIVRDNLALLDDFFRRRSATFSWVRPRAGSVAFPRLVGDRDVDAFAAQLVEREGVLLLPASQFGYPGNHFRLGFGREDLPDALARLETFADEASVA